MSFGAFESRLPSHMTDCESDGTPAPTSNFELNIESFDSVIFVTESGAGFHQKHPKSPTEIGFSSRTLIVGSRLAACRYCAIFGPGSNPWPSSSV
jgi:hypothetical protein